jgi:fatty acid desaturase
MLWSKAKLYAYNKIVVWMVTKMDLLALLFLFCLRIAIALLAIWIIWKCIGFIIKYFLYIIVFFAVVWGIVQYNSQNCPTKTNGEDTQINCGNNKSTTTTFNGAAITSPSI